MRCPARSERGARSLAHDRLERQKLGAVLEVHAIEMVPVAAPDKAVFLENLHDLDGDPVPVDQGCFLLPNLILAHGMGQPILPIPAILRVDVHCDPERMNAQASGPRNASGHVAASAWNEVFGEGWAE